jgi:NAD(P)-dependent dehydrogenase (short-subunit alcohol dehydrogenase family)
MSMQTETKMPEKIPPQQQDKQPGEENQMTPQPIYDNDDPGLGRLEGKVALITGGDSGIGRAVAISYAKEGADVVIVYLDEHEDAEQTASDIRKYGKEPLVIATDISDENNCRDAVEKTIQKFNRLDILVNNAAIQFQQDSVEDISAEQLDSTFRTNIFSQFYFVKFALPHMKEGSTIINTASVTAFRGSPQLMDYSATKGAIIAFTRSLSQSLVKKNIRVNAVAPGPVWTPLIPSSFEAKKVPEFGQDIPMGRPAQPVEIAPCYVFLASKESVFLTGQTLHPNGGTVINA